MTDPTTPPLNVMIGMPSHRGTVATPTLVTLLHLQQTLMQRGVSSHFMNVDYAEVSHSRNVIANVVVSDSLFTHLLFIDDDMAFEPALIVDLIKFDKPIVGAICPKRSIDLEKFFEAAAAGGSFEQAQAEAATFVAKFRTGSNELQFEVKDGWVPLAGIGMGITLIQRFALDELVRCEAVSDRWLGKDPKLCDQTKEPRYGFFDAVYDESSKSMLSEDLSFCYRWRNQCDGEVWGNANYEIGHIGPMTFKGRYIDRLKMGRV